MNNIDKYADWTRSVWISEGSKHELSVCALGLAGESGEAIEHIKKYLRDGKWNEEGFKKEMGDVIYYWARLLKILGYNPSEILEMNVEKLTDRAKRDVLSGAGDER